MKKILFEDALLLKITPEGVVKILDFGLAKAMEPERLGADLTDSPTLSPSFALGVTLLQN